MIMTGSTVGLTSSSTSNTATYGQSVVFTATVAPTEGSGTPSGQVQFYDGATLLDTETLNSSGIAVSKPFTNLAIGANSITAKLPGRREFQPQ